MMTPWSFRGRMAGAVLCVLSVLVGAGTVVYWEFDTFTDGMTPPAVGGERMGLRSAGAGDDFQVIAEVAVERLPNPDSTPAFTGDASVNGGSLRSPGNAILNRYLRTAAGTNVLRLHHSAWTLEGWIRCTGDEPDGFGDVILTTRDMPNWCGLTLKVDPPQRPGEARRLAAYFEVKAHDAGDNAATFSLRTPGVLAVGEWQHLALTWDSRGPGPATACLFIDGSVAARAEAPAAFDTEAADRHTIDRLHVGARQGSERNSFAGDLDEFRISDQVLSPMDMLLFPERDLPPLPASDVARSRQLHPRTPRAGDVLMRTLRWRSLGPSHPRDTMGAMDRFHVTGLVWSYVHDPEAIAAVTGSGRFFQGAVTSSLSTLRDLLAMGPSSSPAEAQAFIQRYACVSLDGSPNEQPWKRHWRDPFSRCSGCGSNAEFEALYVRAMQTYIDAGATMIQRDEAAGNANRPSYGGCFCDHCMRGFRTFLGHALADVELAALGVQDLTTFDYRQTLRAAGAPVGDDFSRWDGGRLQQLFRQYQHAESLAFMARTRAALNAQAGFYVAMSCNNGVHSFDEIMQQFDWFFGELHRSRATPEYLYRTARQAADLDRLQIVTMPKKGAHSTYEDPRGWRRHTRQTIATAYAVGGICMVPWDVYMPNTFSEDGERSSTPRYYGTAEDYADLFGFIRGNPGLFEGYEDAAAVGPGLLETRWGRQLPVTVNGADGVYAFVRARPGADSAPVVIHLVDWRDSPAPFTITLRPGAYFSHGRLEASLRTPAPYTQAAHEKAEVEAQRLRVQDAPEEPFSAQQSTAYALLTQSSELTAARTAETLELSIPVLKPWGMVVVRER